MLLLRRPSVAPEPSGGLALLSGDPIFDGLVGLWVPTISPRNLVGDSALFSAVPSAETGRIAAKFSGEISTESAVLSSEFSFALAFTTGTAATTSCVVGRGPTTSVDNNKGFGFHATHSSGTYAGAVYAGSSYSVIGKPTGGALASNTRYVVGAKASSAGGAVYYDGVRTATSGALSAINTTGRLSFGRNSFSGDAFTTDPSCEWFAVWSKQIDDDLMARAHLRGVNAFFQSRRVFIPVSAAGAYTLTADNAAWNFAAQDAAIKVDRKLSADNAPWEFAAQNAGLTVARKITGDNAAWEFAAQDATLTYTPAGAYVLTAESTGWQFAVPDATLTYSGATTRRRGAAKPLRKGYIIRGKKYFLTDDELAIMVALELETIKRSDIKVPTKGRIKPIPAATFQMVKAVAKKMDELAEIGALEDDDEEEELLSMLL